MAWRDRTFLYYIPVVSFEGGVLIQSESRLRSDPLAFHANLSLKSHMTLYELFNLLSHGLLCEMGMLS